MKTMKTKNTNSRGTLGNDSTGITSWTAERAFLDSDLDVNDPPSPYTIAGRGGDWFAGSLVAGLSRSDHAVTVKLSIEVSEAEHTEGRALFPERCQFVFKGSLSDLAKQIHTRGFHGAFSDSRMSLVRD